MVIVAPFSQPLSSVLQPIPPEGLLLLALKDHPATLTNLTLDRIIVKKGGLIEFPR
jgi:hypothetical protein